MESETWKMYHFNYAVWKSDENIHQKKIKGSAMVCFPVSHYIFTQSHELPYQNSGVYIKLDLEPLPHPVRADLNYCWPLPPPAIIFPSPSREHTYTMEIF